MSHGPEHQIEHAEHAAHAAGDDFNRPVTMSIAIVAAVLAAVTMLGHRLHNDTLISQGEALQIQGEGLRVQSEAIQLQTSASMRQTIAANKWAYYQSKNSSHLQSRVTVGLLKVLATNEKAKDELDAFLKEHQDNVKKYDVKLPEIKLEAEGIEKEADAFMKTSKERIEESQKKMLESEEKTKHSHLVHEKANRFDYGELGLQFGVVLCSLAILTKSKGFWFAGLLSSAIGTAVAMTGQFGLFIGHH